MIDGGWESTFFCPDGISVTKACKFDSSNGKTFGEYIYQKHRREINEVIQAYGAKWGNVINVSDYEDDYAYSFDDNDASLFVADRGTLGDLTNSLLNIKDVENLYNISLALNAMPESGTIYGKQFDLMRVVYGGNPGLYVHDCVVIFEDGAELSLKNYHVTTWPQINS